MNVKKLKFRGAVQSFDKTDQLLVRLDGKMLLLSSKRTAFPLKRAGAVKLIHILQKYLMELNGLNNNKGKKL